jgi:hypothetical protein
VKVSKDDLTGKEKDYDALLVSRKDNHGKEIEFFKWYPSNLLSKPSRSPVSIERLLLAFYISRKLTNFILYALGYVYY